MKDQNTSRDAPRDVPEETASPSTSHDTRTDGFAQHVEMRDEWPSSRGLAKTYGRCDAQGFLVDFEHTTAYLLPRKAPLPPHCSDPLSPSSLTSTTLIDHSFALSEPLIAIPYESTSEADSPSSARPQIRFSDAYRKWWLEQYSRPRVPVQLATKKSPRTDWQGFWLARGTLRGCDKVIEQHAPGYWLAKGTMKDWDRPGGADNADTSESFWKRVTNKMRRISGEEK